MRKFTATPEQREAAAKRREQFRQLAADLAAMPEASRQALVARHGAVLTIEGRELSFVNSVLAISQFPAVSVVGGFAQWRAAGRMIRKGQHGIGIWVPIRGRKTEKTDAPADTVDDGARDNGGRPRFMMGTVFDISQTDPIGVKTPARDDYDDCVILEDAPELAAV